jgi:hypothetical protein
MRVPAGYQAVARVGMDRRSGMHIGESSDSGAEEEEGAASSSSLLLESVTTLGTNCIPTNSVSALTNTVLMQPVRSSASSLQHSHRREQAGGGWHVHRSCTLAGGDSEQGRWTEG